MTLAPGTRAGLSADGGGGGRSRNKGRCRSRSGSRSRKVMPRTGAEVITIALLSLSFVVFNIVLFVDVSSSSSGYSLRGKELV